MHLKKFDLNYIIKYKTFRKIKMYLLKVRNIYCKLEVFSNKKFINLFLLFIKIQFFYFSHDSVKTLIFKRIF